MGSDICRLRPSLWCWNVLTLSPYATCKTPVFHLSANAFIVYTFYIYIYTKLNDFIQYIYIYIYIYIYACNMSLYIIYIYIYIHYLIHISYIHIYVYIIYILYILYIYILNIIYTIYIYITRTSRFSQFEVSFPRLQQTDTLKLYPLVIKQG